MAKPGRFPELDAVSPDQAISRNTDERADTRDRVRTSVGTVPFQAYAPRVIITNSMMVGLFDNQKDWHIAAQMGVANYGQMTAGGWMFIGPQGIVQA